MRGSRWASAFFYSCARFVRWTLSEIMPFLLLEVDIRRNAGVGAGQGGRYFAHFRESQEISHLPGDLEIYPIQIWSRSSRDMIKGTVHGGLLVACAKLFVSFFFFFFYSSLSSKFNNTRQLCNSRFFAGNSKIMLEKNSLFTISDQRKSRYRQICKDFEQFANDIKRAIYFFERK